MSELSYVHPSSTIKLSKTSTIVAEGSTSFASEHQLTIEDNFKDDKPVEIIDDAIEVNEELIEKDQIYSVRYKNEQYYVRKDNNNAMRSFKFLNNNLEFQH